MKMRATIPAAFTVLALLALPGSVQACAACFGRSDSPMAQGMNMGILTLLVVIMSVLVGIAIFFTYILRRAARLARERGVNDGAHPHQALSQTVSQTIH
jgi:hypothetical protein